MSLYVIVRIIHSSCAVLSILWFTARGYRQVSTGSLPRQFAFKVLPHLIDTVLLASAIVLVVMSRQYPFVSPWVTAKVLTLIAYIVLGILLMRLPLERPARSVIFALALLCAVYMVTVAVSKNPMPF